MPRQLNGLKRFIVIAIAIITGCSMVFSLNTDAVSAASKKPAKVTIVSVSSYDYNAVKITWKKAKYAQRYQVYRATSKYGKYKLIKTTTARSYINKKLTTGKKYYFKVRAINGKKKGSFSYKKTATPTLRKVSEVNLTATETTATITYKKVNGASGYQIYRSTKKNGEYTKIKSTTSLTYKNTSRKANTAYYYKVRAYKKVNGKYKYGAFSSVKSIKTEDHNYKTTIIAPSCGVEGYTIYKCSGCGNKYRDDFTPSKEHNYCVPVYDTYSEVYACYSCRKPAHIGDGGFGDADVVCANYGSSQIAHIIAYRCKDCNSLIDVKEYTHVCDWEPVYGTARMLEKCNYCGEQGFKIFKADDPRFTGSSAANIAYRNIHKTNGCYAKCKAEYGDDYRWDCLATSEIAEYLSYWQCSKCSRIKNNNEPKIKMQVEGEIIDVPLNLDQTAWDDLDGSDWIFPTLEAVGSLGTPSAYQPIFGFTRYHLYPASMKNYYTVNEGSCTLCGKNFDLNSNLNIFDWNNHYCDFNKEDIAASLDPDYISLEQVTNLHLTSSQPLINLKWDEVAGADGYILTITSSDGVSVNRGTDMNYFFDNEAESGVTYTYKVKAYKDVKDERVYGKSSKAITINHTTNLEPSDMCQAFIEELNEIRKGKSLEPLVLSESLVESAQEKTDVMYEENSVSAGEDFTDGEEVVLRKHSSVEFVMKSLLNNTKAKRILLSEGYSKIGVGYCNGYWAYQLVE